MIELDNSDKEIEKFVEGVTRLKIESINVPVFRIPNWPKKETGVEINLGRVEFLLPVETNMGMMKLKKQKRKIKVEIIYDGALHLTVYDRLGRESETCESNHHNSHKSRLKALILFYQLRERIFTKIIQQLNEDLNAHDEVINLAKEAIETFVPSMVADKL